MTKINRPRSGLIAALVLLTGSLPLEAQEAAALGFGAQVALVFPASPDLRTTADMPGLSLGLHGTRTFAGGHELRPRVDLAGFLGQNQTSAGSATPQSLDTKVRTLALGADYLYRLDDHWAVGAGLQEIRWSVASVNRVSPSPGNTVSVSGTAHWWRLGLGPVLTCRLSRRVAAEVRFTVSHYGQENQLASTASYGLLWRF